MSDSVMKGLVGFRWRIGFEMKYLIIHWVVDLCRGECLGIECERKKERKIY